MIINKKPKLYNLYETKIKLIILKELSLKNFMQVTKLQKIVLNMGLGEAIKNPKIINLAKNSIELISGQKAIIINAKKSIASFKLRVGMPIGVKVTLRKIKMWEFLDRLINIALPRVRDFRGILSNFDGNGNCSIGIKEEIIFPEIDYDTIDKIRGLNISLITNTKNDKIAKILLKKLGIPFKK